MRLLLQALLLLLPLLVSCAEDLYKILGVSRNADDKELRKAYRTLSKKWHPDKNPGDETAQRKFTDIADAYEALTDPESREVYDRFGHEGLEKHKQEKFGPGGGKMKNPFDLFNHFFGGGHSGFGPGGERKGPSKEVRLSVPLRDFYNGVETQFTIEKQAICNHCSGSGSEDGKKETCGHCRGQGMVVQKMMLAPGIFQQVQQPCEACGGQGKVVRNPCKVCGGAKVVRSEDTHTITVEKGMPKGIRIPFEGEADESPDHYPGDLIVHLAELEPLIHAEVEDRVDGSFFRRKGEDLYWREVLSLREAWMGDWTRNITHLDGHVVQLSRERGQVVQPGMVEIIPQEGMPLWTEDAEEYLNLKDKFGKLHIEYVVILPDQMESGMEKEFWGVWDKWRKKNGVDLEKDMGRPEPKKKNKKSSGKDEL